MSIYLYIHTGIYQEKIHIEKDNILVKMYMLENR